MDLYNWVSSGFVRGLLYCSHDVTQDLVASSPYSAHLLAVFLFRLHMMKFNNSRFIVPSGKTPEAIPDLSLTLHHPERKWTPFGCSQGEGTSSPRSSSKYLFTLPWLWVGHMPISELITVTRETGIPVGWIGVNPGLPCILYVNGSLYSCADPSLHGRPQ